MYWRDEVLAKRRVKARELERRRENVCAEVAMWYGTRVMWVFLAGGWCVGKEVVLAVKPGPGAVLLFVEKMCPRKTGE